MSQSDNQAKPKSYRPKITAEHLAECRSLGYPTVRVKSTTAGESEQFVDACGILHLGRRHPPQPSTMPPADQIEGVVRFLEQTGVVPIKTPNADSYGFKHVAERWLGFYISNGAAIVAADRVGIPLGEYPWIVGDRLNVRLAVSRKWYKSIAKEAMRRVNAI